MNLTTTLFYRWALAPLYIAFIVSAVGAYPILRMLVALKSRQTVSQFLPGHQVKQGTPTMGGLIVALGFLTAMAALVVKQLGIEGAPIKENFCVLGLFGGFALIGFVDDCVVPRMFVGKRGLGWKQKIVMQLAIACACCIPVMGLGSAMAVSVFFVLFFSNAYNFSDGLDALAGLLLLGLAGGLLAIAWGTAEWGVMPILLALLGSILPFLFLNKPKAKVFMGDVGSLPIGAVLGFVVAAIAMPMAVPRFNAYALGLLHDGVPASDLGLAVPPPVLLALFIISGMMIVELVPVPLQILSVKLRKKKLFSFTPIHHAFERKGWPEGKVVIVFALAQLLMSLAAAGIVYAGVLNPPIVYGGLGNDSNAKSAPELVK